MKELKAWKSDPLRDAESRIRALTHEVGSLREDLRRETKRRERAVARAKECEELHTTAQERAQQLEYVRLKLTQQLDAAERTAKDANSRNKKALDALRSGLSQVESAVTQRFKAGRKRLEAGSSAAQQLQALLLSPHPLLSGASPLARVAVADTQQLLQQLAHALQHLGSILAGDAADLTPCETPPGEEASTASLTSCSSDSGTTPSSTCDQDEAAVASAPANGRLRGNPANRRPASRPDSQQQEAARQEAASLKQQLQQLEASLAEARKHSAETAQRCAALEASAAGASGLQQQVEQLTTALGQADRKQAELQQQQEALEQRCTELSHSYNEAVAAAQHHSQRADGGAAARVELEAARQQLQQQVASLQDRCQAAEATAARLQALSEQLQAAVSAKDHHIAQQQTQVARLHSQILDQQADIKSALVLVSRRPHLPPSSSHPHPHSHSSPYSPYAPLARPASADMAYSHHLHSRPLMHTSAAHAPAYAHYAPPLPSSSPSMQLPTTHPAPALSLLPPSHHQQAFPNPHSLPPPAPSIPLPAAHAVHLPAPQYQQHPGSTPLQHPHASPTAITALLPPTAIAQAFHHISQPPPPPLTTTPPHHQTTSIAPSHQATPAPAQGPSTLPPPAATAHHSYPAPTAYPPAAAPHSAPPPGPTAPLPASSGTPPSAAEQLYRPSSSGARGGSLQSPAGPDMQHIGQLKRDMLDLDSEIAELEANLKAATLRLT